MDQENLLTNARWEILRVLSKGRSSGTELAKVMKSSIPNVSQQLKLLEAYDFVEYVRDQRGAQGKPRQLYAIKRDFCSITFVRPGLAEKRAFSPDSYHAMLINVLLLPNLQDHGYLHRYLLNSEISENCAVAFLKSNEGELEVLLLTEELDLIRAKYSNTIIEHNGKPRKIIAWSHNLHELSEGLARKEHYFENLLKNPQVLHDPRNQFDKIKRKA